MKTIGQLIQTPQPPKSNDCNLPTASCNGWQQRMVSRYHDTQGLLAKANPSMQRWCVQNTEQCFFGDFPSLSQLKALSPNTPSLWLIPQLVDLSEYCGVRDKLTDSQLEDLAYIIAQKYYFLKISELMLFFFQFKSGQYGRFYGTVDPLIITTALREFCKERAVAIEQHDQEEAQRLREQAAAEAVTWEEYREKYAVTNETNPFERWTSD